MKKSETSTKGTLRISNEVVLKIAELAACEIAGVASENQRLSFASGKHNRPIGVRVNSDAAEIDVEIMVDSGYKAINVAEAVQQSVKSAVQNMTGIVVSKVNVSIVGIRVISEEE